ncbi:MAG: hypothetical protein KC733_12090, partial [Candidatus Omnitrophica bacterium]|nr:hypothetical protein [Candidatus Omnitrophota bacterium]
MKFKLYFTVVFLILIGFLYYFSNTYQIEITLNNSTENSLKIIEEAQAQCYPNGFPFGGLYTTNGPVNGVCQKVNKYTGG